jgi:phage baseplate assembly protein gpV
VRIFRTMVSEVSSGAEAPAGWVRVEMPHLGAEAESDWTEWPTFSLGGGFGLWMPPRVGVRCKVAFDDNDELGEDATILQVFYDEEDTAPSTDLEAVQLKIPSGRKLELDVGGVILSIEAGQIRHNGNTYSLARADLVESRLQAIETIFNAHSHSSAVPGFPTSPPLAPITPTTGSNATASGVAKAGS